MTGIEFVMNLLDTLPGSSVYHMLIFLGLLPAVGIVWAEWKQLHNEELRAFIYALSGIMGVRILAVILAPAQVEVGSSLALLSAPFLYAVELLSILLLLWAFGTPLWRVRARSLLMVLIGGWGLLLVISILSWGMISRTFPTVYSTSWQTPAWYLLAAGVAFGAGGLLWSRREVMGGRLAAIAFCVLGLGMVVGGVGTLGPGNREGLGRIISLLGYPLFAVVFYQSALQDLLAYRSDLQNLSEQALRQSQELLFLIEATKSIGESLNLQGMLGDVAEHVAMALNADRVAILLRHEEQRGVLTLVTNYEMLGSRYNRPVDVSLTDYPMLGFVMREGQLVYRAHEDYQPVRSLFDLLKIRREGPLLLQPLTRQGRTVGVLVACNDHSGQVFTPEQERLATTIAVQIAGAVENGRLYREIQEKASEIAAYLAQREEDLRRQDAIFESMVEGLVVSDSSGKVLLMNEAAEEILHTSREEVLERDLEALIRKSSLESSVHAEGLIQLDEPLNTLLDLGERKIRVNAAPVRMADGARLGVAAVMQDITREYLAEEAKREFIASISHELRTPLTAIKGYAELLLADVGGGISPAVRQFVRVIRENALRMHFITNNLIGVADLERGRFGLNYHFVEFEPLLRDVLGSYKDRLEDRQLTLQLDLAEQLPMVTIDPHRIRQIIDNLLNNAVKFTLPGGHITIGARTVQDSVDEPAYFSFWVSDTGVGIPVPEQARIWQRFYRADNPLSMEAGGLGIGLPVTKALTEAHGGRIWVESTVGAGSTFTVLLPLQAPGIEMEATL